MTFGTCSNLLLFISFELFKPTGIRVCDSCIVILDQINFHLSLFVKMENLFIE
jgi:hypothetical protein